MSLKNVLLVLFIVFFSSCALSLKVGEKNYPTQNPNIINAETLSYSQLRWKLRTDFKFRYDYAQYAMRQSQSFDWNNPLLNRRYNFYNPYLGYSYFGDRTQMWNDWLWGFTPHRWSIFGQDRWGYNNYAGNYLYGWNNPYGWNNYYGWNNWNTWNSHLNPNWGRTNINGRRVYRGRRATNESGRWESTVPVRRVNTPTRTNTRQIRPIQNDVRPIRTPRRNSDVIPPIRTNPNTTPTRTQPIRKNIRVNPPSRPPMNSRSQPVRRVKKNN